MRKLRHRYAEGLAKSQTANLAGKVGLEALCLGPPLIVTSVLCPYFPSLGVFRIIGFKVSIFSRGSPISHVFVTLSLPLLVLCPSCTAFYPPAPAFSLCASFSHPFVSLSLSLNFVQSLFLSHSDLNVSHYIVMTLTFGQTVQLSHSISFLESPNACLMTDFCDREAVFIFSMPNLSNTNK